MRVPFFRSSAAVAAVKNEISTQSLKRALATMHSKRRGTGETVLEWLKMPAARHGPTNLAEVIKKISYLKSLGVDTWSLAQIASARLSACAQAVVDRPPTDTRRLRENSQSLEIACFLRATLLKLTDVALYLAGRRVNDLMRHASARVPGAQARKASAYRVRQEQIFDIVYSDDQSSDQKIEAIKALSR